MYNISVLFFSFVVPLRSSIFDFKSPHWRGIWARYDTGTMNMNERCVYVCVWYHIEISGVQKEKCHTCYNQHRGSFSRTKAAKHPAKTAKQHSTCGIAKTCSPLQYVKPQAIAARLGCPSSEDTRSWQPDTYCHSGAPSTSQALCTWPTVFTHEKPKLAEGHAVEWDGKTEPLFYPSVLHCFCEEWDVSVSWGAQWSSA